MNAKFAHRLFSIAPVRSFAAAFLVAAAGAGCGGGSAGTGLPPGTAQSAAITPQTRAAESFAAEVNASTATFNTWPMYGFDAAHNGYNPNTKLWTDAAVPSIHLGWQVKIGEQGSQTQPILAANVGTHAGMLFVGGRLGYAHAYDALTGALVWSDPFGTMQMQCVGSGPLLTLGIQSTSVYDPVANVVYYVDEVNASPNAPVTITVYKLDPSTGATLASVDVTPTNLQNEVDFAHTGLTLVNGTLYVGTGSTCDLSSWRGRIAAVNVSTMTLVGTFYPVWSPAAQYSGGGVWGWGGAAVDTAGNVYIGAGNADINHGSKIGPQPPFIQTKDEQVAYGEHLVKLSSDLSTVISSHAVPYTFNQTSKNLDLSGTPVLFDPVHCPSVVAIQGKAGLLNFYNASNINAGPFGSYTFSQSADEVSFIGNGAYSPLTGLYYANVPTSTGGSIEPAGMVAISVTNCNTTSIVWQSTFGADSYNIATHDGQPRSAPSVTAGGMVIVASPTAAGTSQLWAVDATTGAVQNGGQPILTTANLMRMPPVIDGKWMFVLDQGGNLYGLTIDPKVPAVKPKFTQAVEVESPPG